MAGDASSEKKTWWVRSASSGDIFGPVPAEELEEWARESRVFPEDAVSDDRRNWRTARTLPQLRMDTIIATSDGRLHGPLHAAAAEAMVEKGKLPPGAKIFSAGDLVAWQPESPLPSPSSGLVNEQEALEQLRRETQDALAEKDREIETLRESVGETDKLRKALAEAENKAGLIQNELETLRSQFEKANSNATRTASAAELLSDELNVAKSALVAAKTEGDAARTDAKEAKAEAEAAKAEVEAAKAEAEAAKAEVEAAKADAKEARAEAEAAKVEVEAAKTEAKDARAEAEAAKAEVEAAKTEAKDARAEAEAAKANEKAATDLADEAKARADKADSEAASLKEEMAELVDFSNARDRESKATIVELERRISEISLPEVPVHNRDEAPAGDARLVEALQNQVTDLSRERCVLSEKLANAEAALAMAQRPLEADTAVIKKFADEALDALRDALESEKRKNDAERTASVQRQNELHEHIADLERALRRSPGEKSRSEMAEERSERTISQLKQQIDAMREQHKADLGRAGENARELESRLQALQHREAAVREQLRRVEKRTADYDSLSSQLRRREEEIVEAEKQFGEARTQWQIVEQTLRRRIDELEHGAGSLFENDPSAIEPENSQKLVLPGWVRNMK